MSEVQVVRLKDLSGPLFEQAAAVLANAFNVHEDPISSVVFRGIPNHSAFNDLRYKGRLYECIRDFEALAALTPEPASSAGEGNGDGTEAGDEAGKTEMRVGAVAMINPPGTLSYDGAPSEYTAQVLKQIPPEIEEAKVKFFHDLHEWEVSHFGEDKYYLCFLGTADWARRRGLAGALIERLLAQARSEGRDVTLTTQTDENVAYYSKFGFRLIPGADTTISSRGEPMRYIAMIAKLTS